jgi:hypothetical protein
VASDAAPGVRTHRWTASVVACPQLRRAAIELSLCSGLEVGDQPATGIGIATTMHEHNLWLAPRVSPEMYWKPSTSLRLVVGAEAAIPLIRPRLSVAPYGEVFQARSVVIRGFVGIEWVFATDSTGPNH